MSAKGHSFHRQLRESEKEFKSSTAKDLKPFIDYGDKTLAILFEALDLNSELISKLSTHEFTKDAYLNLSVTALAVNAINQLQAYRLCLLNGYLQPCVILGRSAYEIIVFANYLTQYPDKARNWFKGGKIKISDARKSMPAPLDEMISDIYKQMSEMSHPNIESIKPIMGNIEFDLNGRTKKGIGFFIGGIYNKPFAIFLARHYMMISSTVTQVFIHLYSSLGTEKDWSSITKKRSKIESKIINLFIDTSTKS